MTAKNKTCKKRNKASNLQSTQLCSLLLLKDICLQAVDQKVSQLIMTGKLMAIFQKELIKFSLQCISKCRLFVNFQLQSHYSSPLFRLIKLNFQSSIVSSINKNYDDDS